MAGSQTEGWDRWVTAGQRPRSVLSEAAVQAQWPLHAQHGVPAWTPQHRATLRTGHPEGFPRATAETRACEPRCVTASAGLRKDLATPTQLQWRPWYRVWAGLCGAWVLITPAGDGKPLRSPGQGGSVNRASACECTEGSRFPFRVKGTYQP